MTRNLSYRVWDKIYEEYTTDKVLLAPDGRVISRYGFDSHDSFLIVNDVVIEFGTGLKDKNGKEIYEGDIVKIWSDEMSELALGGSQYHLEHYPYTREVKMDSRGVYIEYPGYMLLRQFADVEVIGNINENPELLGGEE